MATPPGSQLAKVGRILSFARPFWHLYATVAVLGLLMQFLALVQPWLMKVLLDDVFINRKFNLFLFVIAGFFAVYAVTQLLTLWVTLVGVRLSQNQQMHIRLKVYDHLQKLHLGFFHKKKVGDLLSRITSDTASIQGFVQTIINTIFVNVISMAAILTISVRINPRVTIFAVVLIPIYVLSERYWVRRLKKQTLESTLRNVDVLPFYRKF
jgi:ABC-type multidrug transport system fused ATPase/permease subunit